MRTIRFTPLLGFFLAFLLLVTACAPSAGPSASPPLASIILATTTSTQDSGLLDELIPLFTKETGIQVKVIAVGTGEALAMGERGDADVLLVHARTSEDAFMAKGQGSLRYDVMYNDFLLVGPPADPARAKGLEITAALQAIAQAQALFVSRGDNSGTNSKELALWKKAAITPNGQAWRLSAGQGMGETARIASEKGAYTLIDRATYLAVEKSLQLVIISEKSTDLLNPYGVIVVNPANHPKVHSVEAKAFADWIVSPDIQKFIGEFGVAKYGQQLFVPDAKTGEVTP
ncbi:MAG: substrate-binding domain-containing protein [Coprothermobacterota bacterium]|nr:substrate-binding domain-containing protein [Coprothermobacterota bacterium]